MPSADSCRTIRTPCDALSHESVTCGRPPEVSLATFDARPPDLLPRRLMDMDFVATCPLVPSRQPRIRFLSIGPHLRYRFLQTTPRDAALASRLPFTSIRLGGGLAPPSCQTCSAHTSKAFGLSNGPNYDKRGTQNGISTFFVPLGSWGEFRSIPVSIPTALQTGRYSRFRAGRADLYPNCHVEYSNLGIYFAQVTPTGSMPCDGRLSKEPV